LGKLAKAFQSYHAWKTYDLILDPSKEDIDFLITFESRHPTTSASLSIPIPTESWICSHFDPVNIPLDSVAFEIGKNLEKMALLKNIFLNFK